MMDKKKDRRVRAMEGMVAEGRKAADRMVKAKKNPWWKRGSQVKKEDKKGK